MKGEAGVIITVRQLMQAKGDNQTFYVSPNATVLDALEMMADKNVGAVMVVEDDEIVGIFTERDYARKLVLQGKTSLNTPIREAMTRNTVTVRPDHTLEECMALMSEWHIRHLPVMKDNKLIGMVSMRDVVEMIISLKDSTISKLENYILSEGYGK